MRIGCVELAITAIGTHLDDNVRHFADRESPAQDSMNVPNTKSAFLVRLSTWQ